LLGFSRLAQRSFDTLLTEAVARGDCEDRDACFTQFLQSRCFVTYARSSRVYAAAFARWARSATQRNRLWTNTYHSTTALTFCSPRTTNW